MDMRCHFLNYQMFCGLYDWNSFFGLIFIINNAIIYFHFVIYKQETYDLKILFLFSQKYFFV